MNKTTENKLAAIFEANGAKFDKACAVAGIKHHKSCDEVVDTVHAFGRSENEEDAVASIVAGVTEKYGHAPNHLDFATRAKEAGVSLDGFFRAWNAGLKYMEDAGYCIDTAPSVNRKCAYLTKQDKLNTLKPRWTGKPPKRGKRDWTQVLASMVKEHGLEAVIKEAEKAA